MAVSGAGWAGRLPAESVSGGYPAAAEGDWAGGGGELGWEQGADDDDGGGDGDGDGGGGESGGEFEGRGGGVGEGGGYYRRELSEGDVLFVRWGGGVRDRVGKGGRREVVCVYTLGSYAGYIHVLGISRLGKARSGWSFGEGGPSRQCDMGDMGGVGCDCGYIVNYIRLF